MEKPKTSLSLVLAPFKAEYILFVSLFGALHPSQSQSLFLTGEQALGEMNVGTEQLSSAGIIMILHSRRKNIYFFV